MIVYFIHFYCQVTIELSQKYRFVVQLFYMKEKNQKNRVETYKKISTTPPAVETFVNPRGLETSWLKSLAHNVELLHQLESHKILNERLDAVQSHLPRPDISLEQALVEHHITETQIADLYDSLSPLLAHDSDYQRILLYLPFEFLPNASWQSSNESLRQAMEQFRKTYISAWHHLLHIHDVRANFVDGDIEENAYPDGEFPRVVKAAHLIPQLLKKGFLSIANVFELLETTDDEILKQNIAETLPVCVDMELLTAADIARIQNFSDTTIREKGKLFTAYKPSTIEATVAPVTFSSIQQRLEYAFQKIDENEYVGVNKKRKPWLKKEDQRKVVFSAGDDIASAILHDDLNDEVVKQFCSSEAHIFSQSALIDGIRKAIEITAETSPNNAHALYAKYYEILLTLWEWNIPDIHNALAKTFYRLHGLHIVNDEQLRALGLIIPALAGPFSENLKNIKKEITDIRSIIAAIEQNPTLSHYIYPVVLVYGSRLKGYSTHNTDIDVAVLVKPETDVAQGAVVREFLQGVFAHEHIHGDVVEFWLEHTHDGLRVRDDIDTVEAPTGGSYWTNVLFGAAWEGKVDTITNLQEQLLIPYCYDDPDNMIFNRPARDIYLEDLERDTLQYRLMHKGYEQFFPARGGIHTQHADQIDGQSMFWDSGYRHMATKLFASRVFLPKLLQK